MQNASTALTMLLPSATSVSAAVAFVSRGGVDELARIVGKRAVYLQIVARGAPITEPDALLALRDELGAEVSVVMGKYAPAFHPKLWLIRSDDHLAVVSGSGNLTRGGLVDNEEQFEILDAHAGSTVAEAHERRYEELTANAVPLDAVVGSTTWREWELQLKARRMHEAALRTLDERLASREVIPNRDADKHRLLDDLQLLYDLTVAAKLPRRDGGAYIPHRFKQGLDRARESGNPVPLVARICRRQTEGFDVILAGNRPDLTVEALVVDPDRPYHSLFNEETRRLSRERLEQFSTDA